MPPNNLSPEALRARGIYARKVRHRKDLARVLERAVRQHHAAVIAAEAARTAFYAIRGTDAAPQ